MECPDAIAQGRDGLVGAVDTALHARIATHEIGRRGVLVEKQALGPDFEGFDDIGGLAGRTARVRA